MIKKLLTFLLFSLVFIPCFSNAQVFTSHPIGVLTPSVGDSSNNLSVNLNGVVFTQNGTIEKFVFAPYNDLLFYWDSNYNPNLLLPNCYNRRYGGEFKYYYLCDYIPDGNFSGMSNCQTPVEIDKQYLSTFLSSIKSSDNWAYNLNVGTNLLYSFDICFSSSSENKSLCFGEKSTSANMWCDVHQRDFTHQDGVLGGLHGPSPFTGDSPYSDLTYTFNDIPSDVIGVPSSNGPINVEVEVGNGLSGYTYVQINTGDFVNYYESVYNFNSDLCYIGTKDLTSNYEDRIPFYQGSGYSIFDFYSKLFDLTNLSISEVGTFVNTWLVNFDTFFLGLNRDSNGNPWFIDYYSGFNDYGVHRGPGLTSPFTNNLSAYYFMSSNIREGAYNVNKTVDGQELALYCYKKGIRTNDGGNYNITDNHDPVYDNRIGVRKRNEENSGYFGSSGEIILAHSWEGTPLDYFTGDGTEDLDFKSFFSNAFNKFAVSYGTLDSSALGIGALPTYIVLFFMALILFRFISH